MHDSCSAGVPSGFTLGTFTFTLGGADNRAGAMLVIVSAPIVPGLVTGRLIRHQRDFGAVLLLDHRYNQLRFRELTPAWLQPLLKSAAMADAPALLANFFACQALT